MEVGVEVGVVLVVTGVNARFFLENPFKLTELMFPSVPWVVVRVAVIVIPRNDFDE